MRLATILRVSALAVCVLVSALPMIASGQDCPGDCDGDGRVAIGELVRGVNIALGRAAIDSCPVFDVDVSGSVSVAELIRAVNAALIGCPVVAGVVVQAPSADFVLAAGTVQVVIAFPDGTDSDSIVVELDGTDVTDLVSVRSPRGGGSGLIAEGEIPDVAGGVHTLAVRADVGGETLEDRVEFRTIALSTGSECDILNNAECLLPYPSSWFETPVARDDGNPIEVQFPQIGIPIVNGPEIPVDILSGLDGFSPTVQILMHFPQGVDPELSDAARLLAPEDPGPPWIDTRTYDGRSLDADSPTILVDADTGERVLHYIENDAHAAGDLARQTLIMRPAESLIPGHRYIVAMRDLRDAAGDPVIAEPAFEVLRDQLRTTISALAARGARLGPVLDRLTELGVAREDLVLAFDFTVQSERNLTRLMLSMRDQAYEWLDGVAAGTVQTFTVDEVIDHDCLEEGQVVWRDVSGTYRSPLFLDAVPTSDGVQFINGFPGGSAEQNGFMDAPFDISIPCSSFRAEVSYPIVLGHGLFGTGRSMTRGIPGLAGSVDEWKYIAGATDWRGLSGPDLGWLVTRVIGAGSSELQNFAALPDRLKQGMLNTLVLARMMKLGLFNRDAAFQIEDRGVFPGAEEEMFYYGISLGGIMGTWLSALTPDVERFGLDVPSINFACLLQRSTQFGRFQDLLVGVGLTDPMQTVLGVQLLHEIWVSSEPAGYARHITTDPLPGSGPAKRILMTPAWLDKQVSNQCTEASARTLGLSNLADGSILSGLQGIPDQAGPLDSAYVMYDTGSFDLFDPEHQEFIPPLANLIPSGVCDPHGARPRIPASIMQLVNFLQPGGVVENFCNGLCDAGDASEWDLSRAMPCDPLAN